ncbi:Anaphase-promoting complex subunit 1 [Aphelenchoides besseyi]|nr:Anaphase-promoting complex subunit 1 [Aphelenchoides besseyi]
MCEIDTMIVPSFVKPVKKVDSTLNVGYRLVDDRIVERVIYTGNVARVYRALTDILLRTHFTKKPIINAFYHDFGVHNNSDPYLCIASADELKLISIQTNECQSIDLPFKLQAILSTRLGLLLVRAENDDSNGDRGPRMLFSLSQPYGELLAVLCKCQGFNQKPFIYIHRRVEFIPTPTESEFVMAYDVDENINYLFKVRNATDDEKRMARLNLNATAGPSQLFDTTTSPFNSEIGNRFSYEYSESRMENILSTPTMTRTAWKDRFRTPKSSESLRLGRSQTNKTLSESATSRLFADLSQLTQTQNFDHTSILCEITGEPEAEIDHNAVEWTLEGVWSDEYNRLPGSRIASRLPVYTNSSQFSSSALKRSNRSRHKLDKEISEQFTKELCLTKRPSTFFTIRDVNDCQCFVYAVPGCNSVVVIRFEDGKCTIKSQPTTIQAAHAIPLLGTKYWICSRTSPVALVLYSGCKKIGNLAISCVLQDAPDLLMNQLLQLICRDQMQFEMVSHIFCNNNLFAPLKIVDFRQTLESSPTKEPASKKARSVFSSPRKRTKGERPMSQPTDANSTPTSFDTVLSIIRNTESQPVRNSSQESPHPKVLNLPHPSSSIADFVMPPLSSSGFQSSNSNYRLVEVWLDPGTTTTIGRKVYNTILESLPHPARMEFAMEWLCSNPHRSAQSNYAHLIEVELAMLFKLFFEGLGVDARNFPFVKKALSTIKAETSQYFLEEKRTKHEVSEAAEDCTFLELFLNETNKIKLDPQTSIKVPCEQTNRLPFISASDSLVVFKAVHDVFDACRRSVLKTAARAREFMIQPLFIFASMHQLNDFARFYTDLDSTLSTMTVMPMENFSHLPPHIQRPPLDSFALLYDSFEMELESQKNVSGPFITKTQYNKLKILATESEINKWVRLRWPSDIRVSNISTMLDVTKPVLIPDLRSLGSTDSQLRDSQEKFLVTVALRTITRSFGSALLNFHSLTAEPMDVALMDKICLNGKISPSNMNLNYPEPDQAPMKNAHRIMMEWTNFYSGVSRGLATILGTTDRRDFGLSARIGQSKPLKRVNQVISSHAETGTYNMKDERKTNFKRNIDDGPHVVDWKWVFAKIKENKECSPALAGYILAAGLSGQNMSVNPFDLHEFLSLSDKLVVVALLLGTSIAYRGTFNFYVNKMIYAHLPFLLQPTSCDFRIDPVVQTVALLSLGCLYLESMQPQLTNDLLNQMSKETFFDTDPASERYAYVLSAGFAVGLINLCKGDQLDKISHPFAVEHLSFDERLFLLLNGGQRDLCIVNYYKDLCVIAQKGCCSCGMSRADQKFQASLHQHHHRQRADVLTASGAGGGAAGASRTSCTLTGNVAAASSHVCELNTVNIHLSSPAACAALTLVYMRTNNKKIADRLMIPNTTQAISLIRPDLVMLRITAAALVNFDSIRASTEWINSQIPEVLRTYNQCIRGKLGTIYNADKGMLARAYAYAKTGACFALALKYTSTCDEEVTYILYNVFRDWMNELRGNENFGYCVPVAGLNTYINCVNVIISALAIVNAGSGNIDLVRHIRRVRYMNAQFNSPLKEANLHSVHVISNMALGLLFLGRGRYGLSRSNISLAALFISFFPIYGHSIADNRCYFQGFRFLWTIAVEPRFVVTVAEGSQETVVAPIEIVYKDENKKLINAKTPLLLPPLDLISVIRIRAADFQAVDLDLNRPQDMEILQEVLTQLSGRLPLKKKPRACGTFEFRTLEPQLINEPDPELVEISSTHSFDEEF